MEENIKEKSKFYISLSQYIPKNKIFFSLILILKFLPLFVITHDWNISYKKGISYWIRKFTLCEFLSSEKAYNLYQIILIILFLFIITINFVLHYYTLIEKKKVLGKIFIYILFYIFYAFNQYIYSIFVGILFNDKNERFPNLFFLFIINYNYNKYYWYFLFKFTFMFD